MKELSVRHGFGYGQPASFVLLAAVALACWLHPASLIAAPGYLLPLQAGSNNRYLVDQNGLPFLIMGDAPQSLVGNLSPSDMATYMADRERLGFNALWVNLLCASYTSCNSNGTTYDGVAPFTTGSSPSDYDLSTPNPAYFSRVDSMVNLAATYNLVVFLDPIETGGWLGTLENNGSTQAYNYGVYIGNRYKNFTNIVWVHGNDFQTWSTSSTDNNLVTQVMAGIASVDPNHLQTIELNYFSSYSNQDSTLGSLLTLDSAYTYYETYDMVLQSYNSSPTIPTYLVEANYEYENNTGGLPGPAGTYVLREQAYWTMLSGGAGQLYGNHYTWTFTTGWQTYLDSPGALEIQYINQLFGGVAWWSLVPDATHQVVTAGYGVYNGYNTNLTTASYCTTSWITSGSLALTYCPNASTLTVNLAEFSGPVTAQWYDPSNGTYTTISGAPFPNSGSQDFTTPGNNHDGDPDWILHLTVLPSQAQNNRSFVATTGNDVDKCTVSAYCRTLAAALAVTDPGGEIVLVDSGGYGAATISQPVVITAIDVDASITATSGNALIINTTGNVTITGLNLNGDGRGNDGILVEAVGVLRLNNVQIQNFANNGIEFAAASGNLAVYDSKVNDSGHDGLLLQAAGAQAYVHNTDFDHNTFAGTDSVLGRMTIADSSAHYNEYAFYANSGTVSLSNDSAIFNTYGLAANSTGTLYFADCLISNNTTAWSVAAGGTIADSSPGSSLITPAQATVGTLSAATTLQ